MFIVYPTNIDYLIEDVRLYIGDVDSVRFSDSLMRGALIGGVKMLQRRWQNRYLVFTNDFIVSPVPADIIVPAGQFYVALPEGYALIASGYAEHDVFRNPYHTFAGADTAPISQEDEYIITLAATVILGRSLMVGSSATFVNWSDGDYSFSNVTSANMLRSIFTDAFAELNALFKNKRASVLRGSFTTFAV